MAMNNHPESLVDQCAKYVVKHLDTLTAVEPLSQEVKLKKGLTLPSEICEKLIEVYQRGGNIFDDKFVTIFENPEVTRLRRVRLRNSRVSDEGLDILLRHNLLELDVANCTSLSHASLENLNDKGDSLVALSLGTSVQILQPCFPECSGCVPVSEFEKRGFILKTPNLRRLAVRKLCVVDEKLYFPLLLKPLTKLTHLDLSACFDLGNLTYLKELPNLVSLILHNVQRLQDSNTLKSIEQLKKLKHLDISQLNEKEGTYWNPNRTLANLVESLPNLVSLDISGTNLAGNGVAEHVTKYDNGVNLSPMTDIAGLRSRVDNPLEFLGLYMTHHEACRRHDVPAKRIAGDADEEQTLNATLAYIDRPDMLQKVLNDLYHLFRDKEFTNVGTALNLVLESMDRHLQEKHIQISGSATLFYIMKNREKNPFCVRVKHQVISTLLNAMGAFRDDETMMRNGCLTLCQFRIPHDVLCDYERLVHILLFIVAEMDHESFVQRIGIYLLNSLACQVDGTHKQLLGDLGAILRMLTLIADRLERRVCDDVLEVAWSTMWNVTDETAVNCQRFLEGNGMEFFLGCLSTFPNKEELLRNMMGLLGNVAEVPGLRMRLMTPKFVSVFTELLDSFSDGIEVSYNAAGVLAHMSSDGPTSWTITEPSRESVLKRMVTAIERWDLATERNINYRSFEPILGLLRVDHTPECQHWATWALANLTKVYPSKYCTLVETEGGLTLLQRLVVSEANKPPRIKELACIVITNCRKFKEKRYLRTNSSLDG